jgi:hypothetical protein
MIYNIQFYNNKIFLDIIFYKLRFAQRILYTPRIVSFNFVQYLILYNSEHCM